MWPLILLLFAGLAVASPIYLRPTDKPTLAKWLTLPDTDKLARTTRFGVWESDTAFLPELSALPFKFEGVVEESLAVVARNAPAYSTHDQLLTAIDAAVAAFPNRAARVLLGRSANGAEIAAAHFFLPAHRRPRPLVVLFGPVHGNEVVGRELLISLLRLMADEEDASIFADADVMVVPTLNPDGFAAQTRNNARNKDLNRSFPDRCNGFAVAATAQPEPEVAAVMAFVERYHPTAMLWMHGGAEVISLPHDSKCGSSEKHPFAPGPENALHIEVAKAYMERNTRIIHYINGARWYPINGSSPDWAFHASKRAVVSMTAEVSSEYIPRFSPLGVERSYEGTYWPMNRAALAAFPRQFAQGVAGYVHDERGNPIDAEIWALPGRTDALPVRGTHKAIIAGANGSYMRPLPTGETTIIVSAEHYVGARFQTTITKGLQLSKNFTLTFMPADVRNFPDGVNRRMPNVE